MPAKSRIITEEDTVKMGKAGTYAQAIKLVKQIIKGHDLIAKVTDANEVRKGELLDMSRRVFWQDLEAGEVYGNHEYDVGTERATVNFKCKSVKVDPIDGQAAHVKLKSVFGEEAYKKLFKEDEGIEVSVDDSRVRAQFRESPDRFTLKVRTSLSQEALRELYMHNPKAFDVEPADLEDYAKSYPKCVKRAKSVKIANKFLETAGKLKEDVMDKAKGVLATLLQTAMTEVVNCGNSTKKK